MLSELLDVAIQVNVGVRSHRMGANPDVGRFLEATP